MAVLCVRGALDMSDAPSMFVSMLVEGEKRRLCDAKIPDQIWKILSLWLHLGHENHQVNGKKVTKKL